MSASCRFSLPAERRSKAYPPPFLTEFPPVSVPLIAMQQGIHGKPKGGDTLGLAVQELSLIVSLVFGQRTAPCKIPENFVLPATARHSKTRPLCKPRP